jgi:hypothetical protein
VTVAVAEHKRVLGYEETMSVSDLRNWFSKMW